MAPTIAPLPTPNPAKPYEGRPQYQAINAYVRKLSDANIARTYKGGRFSGVPMIDVRSNGRIVVDGEYLEVAVFSMIPARRGDGDAMAEADALGIRVADALSAAGWTVSKQTDHLGRQQYIVKVKSSRTAKQQQEADAKEKAAADGKALLSILDESGITGFGRYEVQTHGRVTLSLAQVVKLIEAQR